MYMKDKGAMHPRFQLSEFYLSMKKDKKNV